MTEAKELQAKLMLWIFEKKRAKNNHNFFLSRNIVWKLRSYHEPDQFTQNDSSRNEVHTTKELQVGHLEEMLIFQVEKKHN